LRLFVRNAEEEESGGSWGLHTRSCLTEGVQGHRRRAERISDEPSIRVLQDYHPERVRFAKHREAAEKKAAALAAAEADAEETATSPRAAPKKAGRRGTPAAATATAEGKARKKRGRRPADSPPSPKRTRIVDVETGLVGDVIAGRCVRPHLRREPGGGDSPGHCSSPSARRRKVAMTTAMFASCPLLVTLPASRAPSPPAPKY
jgi:hypothetical protein